MIAAARDRAARIGEWVWEARRSAYARGWLKPHRVDARVVSIGNLSVGGAGKTTLCLHLARAAVRAGTPAAVVCRRYRPGPGGEGDEERLMRRELNGVPVLAGRSKWRLADAGAAAGAKLILVDDGFSHWALARDLDLVLIEARDLAGGTRMLPAGRLREPWRALQRATFVIASRVEADQDPGPLLARLARAAPGAGLAAGRHALRGVRGLEGGAVEAGGRARVVTATGNPGAVARSMTEAGFEVSALAAYRDHHWFTRAEAERERAAAARDHARLLLTPKDAVRWPLPPSDDVAVLDVSWTWLAGGEAVERAVLDGVFR